MDVMQLLYPTSLALKQAFFQGKSPIYNCWYKKEKGSENRIFPDLSKTDD